MTTRKQAIENTLEEPIMPMDIGDLLSIAAGVAGICLIVLDTLRG